MKRRSLLLRAVAATLVSALVVPHALGQAAKPPRGVGLLTVSTEASFANSLRAFRDGLRERGYVEHRDIVIDTRYAGGGVHELAGLAAALAALKPAVIIAHGAAATDAALAATGNVPIVSLGDLVVAGHAAELARPGDRVTGISFLLVPLNAKRLELLAELLPKGSAVLNLADPLARDRYMQVVEDTGRSLGLAMYAAYARTPVEIEAAFIAARNLRVAGVNVLNSPFLASNRALIFQLTANARLPAIYQWPEDARNGGLMGYGPSLTAMNRQLAGFVGRILDGAKPGDLPIEQPTKFELVINLKTAKALGLTVPSSLLLRADEVIQ